MQKKSKKIFKRARVLALLVAFIVTQIIPISALTVFAEELYTQDFEDGDVGGWKVVKGETAEPLSVADGKLVFKNKGNAFIVDENSPDKANGEYEFQFTVDGDASRIGAIFRYTSPDSWAFAGYNNTDGTWLVESPGGWKDGITGPVLEAGKEYIMKVKYVGTKITVFLDGEEVFDLDTSSLGNMASFPTEAGKIGFRSWFGNKIMLIDNIKYSDVELLPPSDGELGRKITNTDVISSDEMEVTIDKDFPNVVKYEKNNKTMYGTEYSSDKVLINGKGYAPKIEYANNGEYTLTIDEINVVIKTKFTVDKNILTMNITEVQENGTDKVMSIEFANQNLLSVRSTQEGAAFAGSRMNNKVNEKGDIYEDVTENSPVAKNPTNYLYAILNTDELSGSIWTNSYSDYSSDNDNDRIRKQTINTGDYVQTSLWSSSWVYRAENMPTTLAEDTIMEEMPVAKVIITEDANNDSTVDWQDGAVAFREIMNNPFGSEDVPDLVVMRIPFNFASQATNPFLKTLDETKKMYLATDGLGQWIELKGYQAEGHDQAHLDYGNHIGVRQGGVEDLNTLVEEGHKYGGYFGVHISATGANPEAKYFNEDVIDITRGGWDWLDPSYDFNKEKMRKEASENNRLGRLQELKDAVPNLDFIYADAFFEQGFNARRFAKEVNSLGWNITTEFPYVLENDSTWYHWSVDYNYGGQDMKGYSSDIARFIRNHQKDTWIVRHPLLGGTEMEDYEGWVGRTEFDNTIKMTFDTNLPTKYMQHFPIIKWTDDTINFENNITVSNVTGTRVMTKDGITILDGNSYLIPWDPKEETKLYHWNSEGGTTTWTLPNSWSDLGTVKLYKLTDTGREEASELTVINNQVTIEAEANVPYVVDKGELSTKPMEVTNWGEGGIVENPGFVSSTFEGWDLEGENLSVLRNDRGDYEVKTTGENTSVLSQKLTGLEPGTYEASVSVEVLGDRKATIGVRDYGADEVSNYTDISFAKNYVAADSKHGSYMQRMSVFFEVPEGKDSATLYLEVNDGTGTVTLDDIRVTKTERSANPDNVYFTQDFENVQHGLYPFVKGQAGGTNDPRVHLSELHAPYTQKGWNGKEIDDVINGTYSLKAHKESGGLLYQTIPQTLRFMPGRNYRVSFKYENAIAKDYAFVIGDGKGQLSIQSFDFADVPTDYTFEFTAPESGNGWIGVMVLGGQSDLVIDNLVVEDLGEGEDLGIPEGDIDPEESIDQSDDISLIPQSGMTVTASSEETSGEYAPASNVIDGDVETFWHSKWTGQPEELPHRLTLDLGEAYSINKVTLVPRQDQDNGVITKYEIHTSMDGENYTKVAEGDWAANKGLKVARFDTVEAKYVKLVAIEGKNGFATAAEINVGRDMTTSIDTTKLSEAIENATKLMNEAVVGEEGGQYPQEAKDALKEAINAAQTVLDNENATQENIDEAVLVLNEAIVTFEKSVIIIVDKVNKLKIIDVNDDSAKLIWKEPDTAFGVVEYVIYQNDKEIATVSAGSTEYKVENLKKDTLYKFKVAARYSNGHESKPKSKNLKTKK